MVSVLSQFCKKIPTQYLDVVRVYRVVAGSLWPLTKRDASSWLQQAGKAAAGLRSGGMHSTEPSGLLADA